MGVGAVGVGLETVGYTDLAAGRGVGLSLASDDTASVAIEVNEQSSGYDATLGDTTEYPFSDPTDVRFTNNSDTTIEIKVTVSNPSSNTDGDIKVSDGGGNVSFDTTSTISSTGSDTFTASGVGTSSTAILTFDASVGDTSESDATVDITTKINEGSSVELSITRNSVEFSSTYTKA
ncbi:hypothetical protein [Natronomonas sp. LN261]|uniref:hypothetical protein n=1 Tax=Natronomonas sp. LN261 TaxID=2750669 RepID=UPI001C67A88E|nr:hypothetical protein [Natronomonas sp. LN261]